MRIVDYANIMSPQSLKRTTPEDRERLKKIAEAIKKVAVEHDVKFVLVKGDKK